MTGTDKLRKAVATGNNAVLAQATNCGPEILEQFAEGKRDLPAEIKVKIAAFIFADIIRFDPEKDELVSVNAHVPPTTLSAIYPEVVEAEPITYRAFNPPEQMLLPVEDGGGAANYLRNAISGSALK